MKKTGQTAYPMEAFVKSIQIYIGNTLVDTHDSTWYRLFDEMYRSVDERAAYRNMGDMLEEPVGTVKTLYLPLIFWFNRHPAHSLAMVALQQEVKLVFQFAESVEGVDVSFDPRPRLYVEQIFLDQEERQQFAERPHKILMEQLQVQVHPLTFSASSMEIVSLPLEFQRPVKSITWVCTNDTHGVFSGRGRELESNEYYGPIAYARFLVENNEHTPEKQGSWFRTVHPFNRTGRIPSVGIYCLMFARYPGDSVHPSGSLNMTPVGSRLQLAMKTTDADPGSLTSTAAETGHLQELRVYAQSWNLLEISNGSAKLAWRGLI